MYRYTLGTGKCAEAKNSPGVGAMLVTSNRAFLRELFNEHRLADVLVHGGGVAANPGRASQEVENSVC